MRWITKIARFVFTLLASFFLTTALFWNAPGRDLDENWSAAIPSAGNVEQPRWTSYPAFAYWYAAELAAGRAGQSSQFAVPVSELIAERAPVTAYNMQWSFAVIWLTVVLTGVIEYFAPFAGRAASAMGSVALAVPAAFLILLLLLAGLPVWAGVAACVWPKVYMYFAAIVERARAKPHVLALLAQGAGPWRTQWHAVYRPLLPQCFGLMALSVPMLASAIIPAEAVGGEPGLGQLAWRAVAGRDLPLLTTLTLGFTAATSAASLLAGLADGDSR